MNHSIFKGDIEEMMNYGLLASHRKMKVKSQTDGKARMVM